VGSSGLKIAQESGQANFRGRRREKRHCFLAFTLSSDKIVALTFLAAHTSRALLGTGIFIGTKSIKI
jgi:hypothetical protein